MGTISSFEILASLIGGFSSSRNGGQHRLLFMHGVPVWEGQERPLMTR